MANATETAKKAKKTQAEKEAKKAERKAQRAARPRYPESIEAKEAGDVNADQKLIRGPTAFNAKLHKTVKKSDFANESVFMTFRADIVEERGKSLLARADEMRDAAKEMARFGSDPAKAAAAKKLAKLKAQQAELEALLADEGISLDA